jgi:Ca2+-binding EF-hand superfamily protein
VLKKLGQNVKNEKRLNKLMTAADPNRRGVITFSKFVILMEMNRKREEQVDKKENKN